MEILPVDMAKANIVVEADTATNMAIGMVTILMEINITIGMAILMETVMETDTGVKIATGMVTNMEIVMVAVIMAMKKMEEAVGFFVQALDLEDQLMVNR